MKLSSWIWNVKGKSIYSHFILFSLALELKSLLYTSLFVKYKDVGNIGIKPVSRFPLINSLLLSNYITLLSRYFNNVGISYSIKKGIMSLITREWWSISQCVNIFNKCEIVLRFCFSTRICKTVLLSKFLITGKCSLLLLYAYAVIIFKIASISSLFWLAAKLCKIVLPPGNIL